MRPALFIIFLSALLCKLSTAQMPYQSHSFNDLEYVLQHLVKGVDSFKIDINSIERTTCEQYSTWKDGDNKCETDNYNTEICCLGLRGDCSSSPRLNDYFNTTNDLLAFLNNTKYDYIWQKQNRIAEYNKTIYIAMNVQFTYVQSSVAKSWLSQMIQVIQQRDLDIKLIMGNPSDAFTYYASLCKNQSELCDDEAKIIANYPFILQDWNDTSTPFGLLENFNTNFSMLPYFCANGFPSFGDPMPYYFYEVAHETDIQFILNTYSSPQCKRSQTHPNISTVRVTSNIDPEMFQSYMPKANPLGDLTDATNILVETFQQDQLVFLVYLDSKNITHVQLRSLTSPLQVISEQQISGGVYTKVSYKAPYLLLQSQAQAQVFSVTNNPSLALQSLFNLTNPGIAVDLVSFNNNAYLVQVDNQGCQAGSLDFVLADLSTGKQLVSQCSETIKAFDVTQIQSADLAVGLDSGNALHGVLFVSISNTTGPLTRSTIYSFSLGINIGDPQAFVIVTPTSHIDFGIDPTVKIVQDNGTFYVLEAHSNGLCQCADFINNGNMFKCGLSNTNNTHISYLQNVPYLMNYNWGRLDDFTDRIQEGRYVNSCDKKIMHAKFYNGEAPSGTVFRNSTTGALQALFVNQYVDYEDLAFVTKLFCGATMPSNQGDTIPAAVANSFNLLDFSLFNYL